MKNLTTQGGRLFSVVICGTPPTLQDTMVAASVYIQILEELFPTAQQLLACFAAWAEEREGGRATLSDEQLRRAKKWVVAHEHADRIARPWLSSPTLQTFLIQVPGSKIKLRIAP